MLTVLASNNINEEELKALFHKLKADNLTWPKNVIKEMPHKYGPDEFFCLPGCKSSVITTF